MSYEEKYDVITNQNKVIGNEINVTLQKDSTSQSKSNYQNIETIKIQKQNYYLFWIYYALILILAYFLYYKLVLDYKYKIAIIILFILYPFIVFPIETLLYYIFNWLWSLFIGIPYK